MDLAAMQEAVTAKGDAVRALKANKAPKDEIDAAVNELKKLKIDLEAAVKTASAAGDEAAKQRELFRNKMGTVLEHKLFYMPAFKIYGGVGGLYDYGPPGCAVKANIQNFWKQHFVLEEAMLELECASVTPESVLAASGHVERFTDLMVKDPKTDECFRADHLLEDALEKVLADPLVPPAKREEAELAKARVDDMDEKELGAALKTYNVKAPETGNELSEPYPFNLMFATQIGPTGRFQGFLRPETAQGIFVNFRELLYYNGNKLPFAAAQIGQSFRNEINPRAGILRVREFTQAEIEHFCHPERKDHPKIGTVRSVVLNLYSREAQLAKGVKKPFKMSVGEALEKKVFDNETLAYFVARTHVFLTRLGINPERLRFRQHLANEMAHYANDCWDAEIECTYGWMECVGVADRSAFDLKAHTVKSKVDLVAFEAYDKPKMVEAWVAEPNKKELGKAFKKDAKAVTDALAAMCEEDLGALAAALEAGSATVAGFAVTKDMLSVARKTKKVTGDTYTPCVIEPSFGIGRIMYCLFEHTFYVREDDEQKVVFRFPPLVAPIKVTVFPLQGDDRFNATVSAINSAIVQEGIASKVDSTGTSIGKRYARTDELGVPFAVTVDYQTLDDGTVTLRERDSTKQKRMPIGDVPGVLRKLCFAGAPWAEVTGRYPDEAAGGEGAAPAKATSTEFPTADGLFAPRWKPDGSGKGTHKK